MRQSRFMKKQITAVQRELGNGGPVPQAPEQLTPSEMFYAAAHLREWQSMRATSPIAPPGRLA